MNYSVLHFAFEAAAHQCSHCATNAWGDSTRGCIGWSCNSNLSPVTGTRSQRLTSKSHKN
jgi:hypothetical protein